VQKRKRLPIHIMMRKESDPLTRTNPPLTSSYA
jgi:hypothetical protein